MSPKFSRRAPRFVQPLLIALLLGLILSSAACSAIPGLGPTETPTATLTFTPVPPTETPIPPTATETPPPTDTPTITPTLPPTETPTPEYTPSFTAAPPTARPEEGIIFYMISKDDGGGVACGDSMVWINTGLYRTGNVEQDVTTALTRLFSIKSEYWGTLYNPVYLSNFNVSEVNFKPDGQIDIQLTGSYGRSGDKCDNSRVREQIWQTVRQFKEIKRVYILINSSLLGDVLANG